MREVGRYNRTIFTIVEANKERIKCILKEIGHLLCLVDFRLKV